MNDRVIQFGAIYWFFDTKTEVFHEERVINQFINTDVEISDGAFAVHWITKEKLSVFKKMDAYIKEFLAYIEKSSFLIAHNLDFDLALLKKEASLCHAWYDFTKKSTICTMKNKNVIEYMWWGKRPKLQELHEKLFGRKFESAHDALADIRATKDCFIELYKRWKIILF